MENWLLAVIMACVLVIGGMFGAFAFPQVIVEEVEVPFETLVYVNHTIEIPVEVEVEVFNPFLWRDEAWNYILDNWDSEDFDDDLEMCGGHKYDLDEIEWDFEDAFKYKVFDYDKNKFKVVFEIEGEYDNDCSCSYDIEVEYYKTREPEVTIN